MNFSAIQKFSSFFIIFFFFSFLDHYHREFNLSKSQRFSNIAFKSPMS